MDLDPRLRTDHGERVRIAAESSATPSPSSQLNHNGGGGFGGSSSLAPSGYHGADTHGTSSSHNTPEQQQQQQQQPSNNPADQDGADAKKSRACEACRGLKVRCDPDPNDEGPCKRCKKSGRKCVVTAPTRKRQKKTDSRVSELEKKIDALTASLQARVAPSNVGSGTSASPVMGMENSAGTAMQQRARTETRTGYGNLWETTPEKSWDAEGQGRAGSSSSLAHEQGHLSNRPPSSHRGSGSMAGQKRKASEYYNDGPAVERTPQLGSIWTKPDEGDIVERGLITMGKAAELFSRYKDQMLRYLPSVVFPPSTHIMELRQSKPILFLAIMAAASSETQNLQKILQKDLMQIFAEKIVINGQKSLELVQALQVAVIWYWPPEHFEELKFYQLTHMAAVMAIDLGLGKKGPNRRGIQNFMWRESSSSYFKRLPPPDATSIECRRAWLTCYFLTTNTSMSLHRPNLVRWTSFMAESVEILETSPDAAPTDKYLCHLVWTHRQAEEVGNQFSLDDPSTTASIADVRSQFALRALERDLDKYKASIPKEMMQPTLKLAFNVLSLYTHEMALQSATPYDQWRPPFSAEVLESSIIRAEPLSAAHVNALSACLTAIDGIFETFLSLEIPSIRCLPVFNLVRVAYAVVLLMKMYISAAGSASELGSVINKDNMRVEYYLEALLEKFGAAAADNKCRPASKFRIVLVMLKSWFIKQGKGDPKLWKQPGASGESGCPIQNQGEQVNQQQTQQQHQQHQHPQQPHQHPHQQQQQHPQQLQQTTVNTPLQLLSEVATGREPNPSIYSSLPDARQPSQPFFPNSGTSPEGTPSTTTQGGALSAEAEVDPNAFQPWMGQSMTSNMEFGVPPAVDGMIVDPSTIPDGFEGGAKMVFNEPWFSDVFQGLPDLNLFSF